MLKAQAVIDTTPGAQASVAERPHSRYYVDQQAEMENCMLRGQNQCLTIDVQKLSGALEAAQSSTRFVHSQAQAHVASVSHKGQSAVDESESFNSKIDVMKSLHHSEIQDQQIIMNYEHETYP